MPDEPQGAPIATTDPTNQPEAVLSVLEEDQLVKAKERFHWGRLKLSPGVQVLLWALRLYVIFMLITVAIHIVNTVRHPAP